MIRERRLEAKSQIAPRMFHNVPGMVAELTKCGLCGLEFAYFFPRKSLRETAPCLARPGCLARHGRRTDPLRSLRIHPVAGDRRNLQGQDGHRRVDRLAVGP